MGELDKYKEKKEKNTSLVKSDITGNLSALTSAIKEMNKKDISEKDKTLREYLDVIQNAKTKESIKEGEKVLQKISDRKLNKDEEEWNKLLELQTLMTKKISDISKPKKGFFGKSFGFLTGLADMPKFIQELPNKMYDKDVKGFEQARDLENKRFEELSKSFELILPPKETFQEDVNNTTMINVQLESIRSILDEMLDNIFLTDKEREAKLKALNDNLESANDISNKILDHQIEVQSDKELKVPEQEKKENLFNQFGKFFKEKEKKDSLNWDMVGVLGFVALGTMKSIVNTFKSLFNVIKTIVGVSVSKITEAFEKSKYFQKFKNFTVNGFNKVIESIKTNKFFIKLKNLIVEPFLKTKNLLQGSKFGKALLSTFSKIKNVVIGVSKFIVKPFLFINNKIIKPLFTAIKAAKGLGIFSKISTTFTKIAAKSGVLGKSLGFFGKVLGKLALPLTLLFSAFDFIKGFNTDSLKSFGEKLSNGIGEVLNGLTFGLIDKKFWGFYRDSLNENVFAPLGKLGEKLGDGLYWLINDLPTTIKNVGITIFDWFKNKGIQTFNFLGDLSETILNKITNTRQLISNIFSKVINNIAEIGTVFWKFLSQSLPAMIGDSLNNIMGSIKDWFVALPEIILDKLAKFAMSVSDIFINMTNSIISKLNKSTVFSSIFGKLEKLETMANKEEKLNKSIAMRNKVIDSFKQTMFLGKNPVINQVTIPPLKVEAFAKGGDASANKPMLVGEQGPELLIPNVDWKVLTNEQTKGLSKLFSQPKTKVFDKPVHKGFIEQIKKDKISTEASNLNKINIEPLVESVKSHFERLLSVFEESINKNQNNRNQNIANTQINTSSNINNFSNPSQTFIESGSIFDKLDYNY